MWEKNLNALLALILAGVLLGGFGVQIFKHEEPCPLCLLQRLGMLGVAAGALMNTKFGSRPSHYALSLLSAISGAFIALRHIALHVCPGFSSFGTPVWGLSLYTWSFIVFACSITYISFLLLFFDRKEKKSEIFPDQWYHHLIVLLLFLISIGNLIWSLIQCGWGACD